MGLDLPGIIDRCLPKPGSGAGYKASEYVFPLVLMLNGGGRSLEDLRVIRSDVGLREILPLGRIPSSDATGDWLRRMGQGEGLEGLAKAKRQFLKRALKYDGIKGYALDIDATGIEAQKESAAMTYKGFTGYMPIVGNLAENGLVVGDEFREGNQSPGSRNLEFIKYCIKQMPRGKRIKALRADAASYQADIINFCYGEGMHFAIGADLDEAVVRAIKSLPESEWQSYRGGHIAETVHSMNRTKKAFRLIVVRRPYQRSLFGEEDIKLSYKAIASNRADSTEAVMDWYHQRGECSENRIKELKIGFGMERMPCGQTVANAKHQVQTVRWRLFQTAGKVVDHANRVYLKVRCGLHALFDEIRLRIWEFAQT